MQGQLSEDKNLGGNCPGEKFKGSNCSGGSCPGGNYSGVIAWEVKVRD